MNTPKHTPGPWKATVTRYPDGKLMGRPYVTSNATGQHVAELFMDTKSESDAALISSAPDLLEALRESVKWLQSAQADEPADYHNEPLDDAIEQALAAIAKAEGRQ